LTPLQVDTKVFFVYENYKKHCVNVNASVQMLYSVHGGVLWRLSYGVSSNTDGVCVETH